MGEEREEESNERMKGTFDREEECDGMFRLRANYWLWK